MTDQLIENAVLVSGAGRRVGFHIAQRLHQDGYNVVAHYRTATNEIQVLSELGIKCLQADFSSTENIFHFIELVKANFKSLRAIIHNASCFSPTDDDLSIAAEQYHAFFYAHMMAPFLINESLRDRMNGKEADIVHITDINVENPTPRFDIYGTTKAGLHNLTLAQAKKFAPQIKVNAVAPGPVLFTEQHDDRVRQQMLSETPLAREGGAEPVYLAIRSLLTNSFLTGVSIPVDGGRRLSKT
jgi:dihydromonapterin reductase/dihydrofolate reductase